MRNRRNLREVSRRIGASSVFHYGLASTFPRIVATAGILVITPLGLSSLGTTQFGYWLLATSVAALVVSPDLGLGNSIVNDFAEVRNQGDAIGAHARRIRGLVRVLTLVAIGWLLLGVLSVAIYVVIFNADDSPQQLFWSLVLGLACFLLAVPTAVIQRVQLSFEVAARAVLWEGVGKVIAVAGSILVLIAAPNLFLLIVAYMLPVSVCAWVNAIQYCRMNGVWLFGLQPSWRAAFRENRSSFDLGRWFLLIQVSFLLLSSVDPYLLNAFLGPGDVVYNNVVRRPFDLLTLVVSMYAVALWPVLRRLMRSDHRRLSRVFVGALTTSVLLVAVGGVGVILFAVPIYAYLGAGEVVPLLPDLWFTLLLVLGIAAVMIMSNLLNALNRVRSQAVLFVLGGVAVIGAKIMGTTLGDVHGFIAASAISYAIFLALPLLVLCLTSLHKSRPTGALAMPIYDPSTDPD